MSSLVLTLRLLLTLHTVYREEKTCLCTLCACVYMYIQCTCCIMSCTMYIHSVRPRSQARLRGEKKGPGTHCLRMCVIVMEKSCECLYGVMAFHLFSVSESRLALEQDVGAFIASTIF